MFDGTITLKPILSRSFKKEFLKKFSKEIKKDINFIIDGYEFIIDGNFRAEARYIKKRDTVELKFSLYSKDNDELLEYPSVEINTDGERLTFPDLYYKAKIKMEWQ